MGELFKVKITIWGIVQGVGFRPFVARLAARMDMRGEVCNIGGLVEILLTDTEERIRAFLTALETEKPAPAEIVHIKVDVVGSGRAEAEDGSVDEGRHCAGDMSVQRPDGFENRPISIHAPRGNMPVQRPDGFVIAGSREGDDRAAMVPADQSFCEDCHREMLDPENPRFLHPFINCYACGPRYSIIDKIPYDRENTAMVDFPMCDYCRGQYTDSDDRRFHAQTISCYQCGPVLRCHTQEPVSEETALAESAVLLRDFGTPKTTSQSSDSNTARNPQGSERNPAQDSVLRAQSLIPLGAAAHYMKNDRIIAFKSVGGYNLLCSPFSAEATADLRKLKGREEKPFAVMFRDSEQIRKYCKMTVAEEELLTSAARPIVLLEKKDEPFCYDTCRTSRYVGAFLPSMGAQWMLIHLCGPLIVTSGNHSDFPIIRTDEEMLDWYRQERDNAWQEGRKSRMAAVFSNDRDIRVTVDDSVVRVIDRQPQITRRSKGYAPVPLYLKAGEGVDNIQAFAAGADLKNSFALSKGPFSYVSQYFGDLDSTEISEIYAWNQKRVAAFFRIKPQLAVCDLHPRYRSTQFAERYAEEQGIPLIKVQHHHAHAASVMAEHNLKGPVLGVSFDGTGYGTDGRIWGGEFLVCNGAKFRRVAHLEYVKMLGGDSSMKEGWKSNLCWLHHFGLKSRRPEAPLVAAALGHNVNAIESSSMGRLFDAIASFMGIHDVNRYEGECAILLENAAAAALEAGIPPMPMAFWVDGLSESGGVPGAQTPKSDSAEDAMIRFSPEPIFRKLYGKELTERGRKAAALGFHYAVAEMIAVICEEICHREGIRQVALSGGVFQNKILMERTLKKLRAISLDPYYNISVSPNDGGICLGQNYIGIQTLAGAERN